MLSPPPTNLDLPRDFISFFGLFLNIRTYCLYFLSSDEDGLLSFSSLCGFARSTRPSSMNVYPPDTLDLFFFMILISYPNGFSFSLSWLCALLHISDNLHSASQRMQPNCRIMAEQNYTRTGRTNSTFAVDALQTQKIT